MLHFAAMSIPESRFARALAEYLETHTQLELATHTGVNRAVIGNISTGTREPARKAAKSIIRGIPEESERRRLLREWLEDNIPDNCSHLLQIIDATGTDPVPPAAAPSSERERAIAWLQHQLTTNLHAVHCVIDLYRAAGSPTPSTESTKSTHPPQNTAGHDHDGDPTTAPRLTSYLNLPAERITLTNKHP
jgi:hypothetical protein